MENLELNSYSNGFRKELQISITPVLFFMLVVAIGLVVLTENMERTYPQRSILILRIALDALILFSWLIKMYSDGLAKYFLITGLSAYILAAALLQNMPALLLMLFIPVFLAGGMLGPSWGLLTAGLLSGSVFALKFWLPGGELDVLFWLSLISLLGTAGFMFAIYHPVYDTSDWVWKYYTLAVQRFDEAGRVRIELNQVMEEMLHMNRQLALANEKQIAFRTIAEDAQKTKAAFVAKVSHEFRTPLNMIIGLVNLMIENPQIYGRNLPKAMLDDLMIIQRNCEHLTGMINDVLALSQAESGRLTLHRENVDLREIIVQSLEVVSPLVNKKGLDTNYSVPDGALKVYCDRTRIRQVLLNLVSNAARFTEKGGIYIEVENQPSSLLVSVRDTGPGISAEDVDRIFDPFCQGSNPSTWRDKGGTGLGLTISKQFIELHGGKIWVESQVGNGSTFFFILPKDQPVGPLVTTGRWLREDWPWIKREGKATVSSDALYRPRIALLDPERVLVDIMGSYKELLEFSVSEDIPGLMKEIKTSPANLILINAVSQASLNADIETMRRSVRDTPVIGCVMPKQVWSDLSKSVARILVKPVTRHDLLSAIAQIPGTVHTILIVDNDPEITNLYARLIATDHQSFEITTACDGLTALKMMREKQPDLVMLDISMPDIDGFGVLAQKDEDESIASIPVMVISAMDLRSNPLLAECVVAAMADGIGPVKLINCAMGLSELLMKPEMMLGPVPG
jgi:signal transduction histidine kinase/CheY-like chemotaxis protein